MGCKGSFWIPWSGYPPEIIFAVIKILLMVAFTIPIFLVVGFSSNP